MKEVVYESQIAQPSYNKSDILLIPCRITIGKVLLASLGGKPFVSVESVASVTGLDRTLLVSLASDFPVAWHSLRIRAGKTGKVRVFVPVSRSVDLVLSVAQDLGISEADGIALFRDSFREDVFARFHNFGFQSACK